TCSNGSAITTFAPAVSSGWIFAAATGSKCSRQAETAQTSAIAPMLAIAPIRATAPRLVIAPTLAIAPILATAPRLTTALTPAIAPTPAIVQPRTGPTRSAKGRTVPMPPIVAPLSNARVRRRDRPRVRVVRDAATPSAISNAEAQQTWRPNAAAQALAEARALAAGLVAVGGGGLMPPPNTTSCPPGIWPTHLLSFP